MAAIAGRVADGVNFHAWEPDLPGLIAIARGAAAERAVSSFHVSVEAPFDASWIRPDGEDRCKLAGMDVDQIVCA